VGGVGVGVCGRCGGVGSLLTFDIPQTALVATLDTYDFIIIIIIFIHFSFQLPNNKGNLLLQNVEDSLKLDEILDLCADFEKQIQAEQAEMKLIQQHRKSEETAASSLMDSNPWKPREESPPHQFGAISFFPSSSTPTTPGTTKMGMNSPIIKSPTNGINSPLQWSPLNTMHPNRYLMNHSYFLSL
jgi:hypothetical protein